MTEEKQPYEYTTEEIKELLAKGIRYRHLRRRFERPGIEHYINKWVGPILFVALGAFLQKFLQGPVYKQYPPRSIEGDRVQRYHDTLYYMNTRIDSAVLDFGD